MELKLGQTVYLVDCNKTYAYKESVGYIGENSFVVENYNIHREEWQERFYNDEGKTWFATLNGLKHVYPNAKYLRYEDRYALNGGIKQHAK